MGWQIYEDRKGRPLRWAGYGVPAYCDHPDCNEKIDRGLAHVCGDTQNEDRGCSLHFCAKHLYLSPKFGQLCERCYPRVKKPFEPKLDHPEWVQHVLTDESWKEWREENLKYAQIYNNDTSDEASK